VSAVGQARAWLRAILQRGRMDREMNEEMQAHIAQTADRYMARGLSKEAAWFAARQEFGHVGTLQNHGREARGGLRVESVFADVRYAIRHFARTPLSTFTMVLTLALGVGFSSAVFSVLSGIFTRPAPGVPRDDALVKIRGISNAPPFSRAMSYPELTAYSEQREAFESVAGWVTSGVVLDLGNQQEAVRAASAQFVTPNYFATLGVRITQGRAFGETRFGTLNPPELTAVISEAFAGELFGETRLAIGRQVRVNDAPVTIVGIAPPKFRGAVQSGETRRVWLPLSSWQSIERVDGRLFTDPNAARFEVLARLRPGVGLDEAMAMVRGVAARNDADARALARRTWTGTADVVPLRGVIDPARYANERGPVSVLFTMVALLILAVCTTTVNSLLVGAAVARRHEVGVRLALGASRARIVRQLLTEITIVSIAGGALGMWVFGMLGRVSEVAQDGFDVSPNWGTAAFTLAYAVFAATLAGLSPALHATRAGVSEVLKDNSTGATRKSRLQRTLVIAQIALAQPLLFALAAVTSSVFSGIPSLENVAVRERLVVAEFNTELRRTMGAADRMPDLARRLSTVPGIVAVLPVPASGYDMRLEAPEDSAKRTNAANASGYAVPPNYFAALGVPLVRGREFVPNDTLATVTPVVINKLLASQLFQAGEPLGRRLRWRKSETEEPREYEVVGVVDMTQENTTLGYPSDLPPLFAPFKWRGEGRLLIRTSVPAEGLIPTIRAVALEEARLFPLSRIGTLAQTDVRRRESRMGVFGVGAALGALGLLLASIGLYAMLSITVGERRREIGVRVALGARPRQVVGMFFRSGLRLTLTGLAIGLPFGLAAIMVVTDVTGLSTWRTAALVTLGVVGIGALASWLPARRAARVDPMDALRAE
jgi:predicted permease